MSRSPRAELKHQTLLVKSYNDAGGWARKWNSEWQAGPPDIIAHYGETHFVEMKHLPDLTRTVKNPMTPKQREEAKRMIAAGASVYLGVVRGDGPKAEIAYFDPESDYVDPAKGLWVRRQPGVIYDVRTLMEFLP